MKKQFLIWLAIAFILFGLGSFIGSGAGTLNSIFYWPIVIWFAIGLIYFGIWGIKGLIK